MQYGIRINQIHWACKDGGDEDYKGTKEEMQTLVNSWNKEQGKLPGLNYSIIPYRNIIVAVCDMPYCTCEQEWDNSDLEYQECPEGWGALILSDCNGELQTHYICPSHIYKVWTLLSP